MIKYDVGIKDLAADNWIPKVLNNGHIFEII